MERKTLTKARKPLLHTTNFAFLDLQHLTETHKSAAG